jgi:hypothetical protein
MKSNRQTRPNAREIGHVNIENPRPLRWSEFPITFSRLDHWVHIPDPGTYPLVVNPLVNGAWLPKTLIDGGSSLNIIFIETLRKMEFDFSKMTACDEPFYGVVPRKAAYPIGRVCLPITFGIEENFRTEYLTFEVADFRSSYPPSSDDLCLPCRRQTESFLSSGTSWSPTIARVPLLSSPKIQQSATTVMVA